nr:MAG TPA: hypothetical protein [Caudoviricetes sp.]
MFYYCNTKIIHFYSISKFLDNFFSYFFFLKIIWKSKNNVVYLYYQNKK